MCCQVIVTNKLVELCQSCGKVIMLCSVIHDQHFRHLRPDWGAFRADLLRQIRQMENIFGAQQDTPTLPARSVTVKAISLRTRR